MTRLTPGPLLDFLIETVTDTDEMLQLYDMLFTPDPGSQEPWFINKHDWEKHREAILALGKNP